MNKNRKYILYALILCAFIGGYKFLFASMDVHYKLTINVETPEGMKSGYAVREITNSASRFPLFKLPGVGNPAQERGEAVVVDLGDRGVFFALIDSKSDQELFTSFPSYHGGTTFKAIQYYDSLNPGLSADLPIRSWPQMVTFTDLDDPKTVTPVLKTGSCWWSEGKLPSCVSRGTPRDPQWVLYDNQLEELFGRGVKIQSIIIEITDEEVSKGRIDEYLPDFDEAFWAWRRNLPYEHAGKISGVNFKGRF